MGEIESLIYDTALSAFSSLSPEEVREMIMDPYVNFEGGSDRIKKEEE